MKTTFVLSVLAGSAMMMACSQTPPPKDLVDARNEMNAARQSGTDQFAPAQMHVASEELQMAEQACSNGCDSFQTRDRSYVALRKIQLAEQEAQLAKANQQSAAAAQQVRLTDAQIQTNTQNALAQTRDQLAAEKEKTNQVMAELARVAAMKQDERGLVITLSGAVLFETNKDALLGSANQKLDEVAQALNGKLKGRSIEVQGYTDSQGSADYNLGLSQRRADSVRNYLIKQGVPSDKVTARGYGKDRPVADNSSPEGRADNRRVEIVVHPADGSASGSGTGSMGSTSPQQ